GLDCRAAKRGVVTEDAAGTSGKSGGALSHHHVVEEKERQGGGVDPLCCQRGDDRAFHMRLPPVDVHNPNAPTAAGGIGRAVGCRYVDSYRGESSHWTEHSMVTITRD